MSSALRRFVQANRRVCAGIERRLPHRRLDISALYEQTVVRQMRELGHGTIAVDAGGGRRCAFAERRPRGVRIVAVDSSEEELRDNREVDETRAADITKRLPFADGEVGIVASKHVLEHLERLDGFVAEASRVLRPGGFITSLFPTRYAPFAVLNRLLPARLAHGLLHATYPDTEGSHRFRAHYDRCYYSAFTSLLTGRGFRVEQVHLSYYQSHYFGFLVPLYLFSVGYELPVYYAKLKDLAACLLVVARKP